MNGFVRTTRKMQEELFQELRKIKGGYEYMGICSEQLCFPLRNGGELRFMIEDAEPREGFSVDLYGGELPPGITGSVSKTGERDGGREE